MSPKKSRKAISAPRPVSRAEVSVATAVLLLAVCVSGCRREAAADADAAGISVRAAHLTDYAWQDRNHTGQPDSFKPDAEVEALLGDLLAHPDRVLMLRGLGSESSLRHLREALAARGRPLVATYVHGPTVYAGLGFLSTEAPAEFRSLSDQEFRIRNRAFRPLAGGILLDGIWFWNARMPDPADLYERRRNEARMLSQALRPLIDAGMPVLLSLHSREEPGSPMIRMLEETGLQRILAADPQGDGWTFRDPDSVHYRMDQWLFGSPALLARLTATEIPDRPALRQAGRFRHQRLQLSPKTSAEAP